jgi:hypothetical protein
MPLPTILRLAGAVLLTLAAAFGLQGFLATFEPTASTTSFLVLRVAYGMLVAAGILAATTLVVQCLRRRRST